MRSAVRPGCVAVSWVQIRFSESTDRSPTARAPHCAPLRRRRTYSSALRPDRSCCRSESARPAVRGQPREPRHARRPLPALKTSLARAPARQDQGPLQQGGWDVALAAQQQQDACAPSDAARRRTGIRPRAGRLVGCLRAHHLVGWASQAEAAAAEQARDHASRWVARGRRGTTGGGALSMAAARPRCTRLQPAVLSPVLCMARHQQAPGGAPARAPLRPHTCLGTRRWATLNPTRTHPNTHPQHQPQGLSGCLTTGSPGRTG